MGKPKYVDCWTYPKPVLDAKLGEIKTDVSAVSGQVETLSESFNDLSGDFETLADNMADEYSPSSTYSVGDLCIYENTLYKCTTAIETAEEWTVGHWTQTTIADTIDDLSGSVETLTNTTETINENIADSYDSTSTYSVGDLCIYENELYKCTTAIETAEEWTVAHWTQRNVSEEVKGITGNINTLSGRVTTVETQLTPSAVTVISSTETANFSIVYPETVKSCYMIKDKICYVSISIKCNSPAGSSVSICSMPNLYSQMGLTANFILRNYYNVSKTLAVIIQYGKMYVIGGESNVEYTGTFSYPVD